MKRRGKFFFFFLRARFPTLSPFPFFFCSSPSSFFGSFVLLSPFCNDRKKKIYMYPGTERK